MALVFGGKRGNFNVVLQLAQRKLGSIFGMELVELMTRGERDKEQNAKSEKKKGIYRGNAMQPSFGNGLQEMGLRERG